jgi:hypothetical protein
MSNTSIFSNLKRKCNIKYTQTFKKINDKIMHVLLFTIYQYK